MSDTSVGLSPDEAHRPRRRLSIPLERWKVAPVKTRTTAKREDLSAVLRRWHQRAGLFACLFMVWLGASGFLLNQSASWGLDAWRIDTSWLMNLYGLRPEPPQNGFLAGEHWLASTTENTVVDGAPLEQVVPSPLGLAVVGSGEQALLFVAAEDRLVILGADGARIDELRGYTLPVSAIRRIGSVPGGGVAIQDLDVFVSRDGLDWSPLPVGAQVSWSHPEALTAERQEQVLPFARPSVALEQILIDTHSGRLFGRGGPWVINLVGFAAILLGISGIWMYWRTSRRRRARKS